MLRNKDVSTTSKSPLAVIQVALRVARDTWPEYSHVNSPKKFTQHQLFACLVLKSFWKTDYRGVTAFLRDLPNLVAALGLRVVPHFTTLQKAAKRLLVSSDAQRALDVAVRQHLGRKRCVATAAADSTGLECSCASAYFVRRRDRVGSPWKKMAYHRYPKLSLVCEVRTHFVLAARAGSGPRPDIDEFRDLLRDARRRCRPRCILADAGFDSEANHCFARQSCGVRTIIPARHGRPTSKPARGHYRRLMQTRFDATTYAQRAQVETTVSMLKRRQGAFVAARRYWCQCRELLLKAITHNIMILFLRRVFYRAGQDSLFCIRERGRWENGTGRIVWARISGWPCGSNHVGPGLNAILLPPKNWGNQICLEVDVCIQ